MAIRVFVYGTLKPGGYYWPRFCEGKVTAHEPAQLRGRIYDLKPGYPGMTAGEDWVQGVLLTLKNETALAGLDYLEGYAPNRPAAQNEYLRVEAECFRPDGASLGMVWTYQMREAKVREFGGIYLPEGVWNGPLKRG